MSQPENPTDAARDDRELQEQADAVREMDERNEDLAAATVPPSAITGIWSDMESHARYLYDNPEVALASEWEMAEAVLVLLGLLDKQEAERSV